MPHEIPRQRLQVLGQLDGDVRQAGSSVGALATASVATEGIPTCVPAAHHTPRHPCRVGHDVAGARRAEHRGAVSWHCKPFLGGSLSDTQARDMGELMTRYTLFASAVAARGALLKSEVVHTLHTTVFTVLMEDAGDLDRANADATKLTDIAPDMDLVLAQQKAEKRLLLLDKANWMIDGKSARERFAH